MIGLWAIVGLSGCAAAVSSDELQGVLRPYDGLYRPDGPGRFPAVVLLHGCYGVRGKEGRWAAALREDGYVALVVDSMTGRGLTTRESLRTVCTGLGVRAIVAFYPYCGLASRARWSGLPVDVPLLMLLAGRDGIVSPDACLGLAEAQARRGQPVTTKLYADAGHAFDWRETPATRDARARVREFLTAHVVAAPARVAGDPPVARGARPPGRTE